MEMPDCFRLHRGITLIEMMIALAVFGILLVTIYPTFSSVTMHINELNDKQDLTEKGQRVLDYLSEELRMAGLFVGATPSLTFCASADTNSLVHVDGAPYDRIAFFTSKRITTTENGSPFLRTTARAASGSNLVSVNAIGDDVSSITPASGGVENAASFITFDTLQPNLGTLVYQVAAFGPTDTKLTLLPALDQNVNALSNAYSVVRIQFDVDVSTKPRSLRLLRWNKNCGLDPDWLVASHGSKHDDGGVDGFQVEYLMANGSQQADLAAGDIVKVRAIVLWVLLRADFPAREFVNNSTYTLGQARPVVVAVHDHYRRVLLTRIVEVKNVGL